MNRCRGVRMTEPSPAFGGTEWHMRKHIIAACVAGLVGSAWGQPATKSVGEALDVGAFSVQELRLPEAGRDAFTVSVHLGGRDYRVLFEPASVRGPNFRVLVQG